MHAQAFRHRAFVASQHWLTSCSERQVYFLFVHAMASEGVPTASMAMQGRELKALLKETIRELLHEEPGLFAVAGPSSAAEKPHTGAEPHSEFRSVAQNLRAGRRQASWSE